MIDSVQAIILAAGRSKRFHTISSKLLAPICGQEMVLYPLQACEELLIPQLCVIGHQKTEIKELLLRKQFKHITFVEQSAPQGTGHAVACTKPFWHADSLLIMNGDMPLVTSSLLQELIARHQQSEATITFVTAQAPQGASYGRVIKKNTVIRIIEARDCTLEELKESYINAGIYIIKRSFLEQTITQLACHESGEYYITDLIALAAKNHRVETYEVPFDIVRGVNTLEELAETENIKRRDIIRHWMRQGVRFTMPETVFIDNDVIIGANSHIDTGAIIRKGSRIGECCTIESYSDIRASVIHHNVTIKKNSLVDHAEIYQYAEVGPFAHIKNKSILQEKTIIGNFVEINRSFIGAHSKAKHLSYVGDAELGENVNIGAGAITCNYNGVTKEKTIIDKDVFIGSNTSLIAPLAIGEEAIIAAGSTITQSVPAHALAIARSPQINKPDYAQKLRAKYSMSVALTKLTTKVENI